MHLPFPEGSKAILPSAPMAAEIQLLTCEYSAQPSAEQRARHGHYFTASLVGHSAQL
jgi:hypothetical protein